VDEPATGHPDRQAGELVFLADLVLELRTWPSDTWTALGVDLERVAGAMWPAGGAARSAACSCRWSRR
jgi:hypothetical protein